MAKFNTPISNTPHDPFSYEKQVESLTGEKKQLLNTPISSGDNSLSTLSNLESEQGYSLLTSDAEAAFTINETKAANQGSAELAGKMLYNIGNTVLFETSKLPGYLVGGVGAISDKIQGKENPISNIVDNFWVNALEGLQEQSKELVPVHISKDVQDGNLLTKATSGQWWASTGADGIGFLLSMMLPGQALKTLGIGAKIGTIGESLGNNSKFLGKLLSKAGALEDIAKSGQYALKSGVAKGIDSFAAASLNTFAEASAEGANTYDNVKKAALAEGLSEEEASIKAGNSAAGVFKANMALLIGSNLLDEAWLWKGFSNTQKGASNKILDQIFKKLDDGTRKLDIDALKNLSGKGWKDYIKEGAKNYSKQFAKEGFFEEGAQTTLQQNIEKEGDAGFVNNLYNVGANYFKDFMSNKELHESIFLGGFLGGGMSIFQTKNEIDNYNNQLNGRSAYNADSFFDKLIGRQNKKEQQGLKGLFTENYINNFNSITDIAQKENGKIVTHADGRIVVDETKLADLAESKANIIDAHIKYDIAVATGDKIAQDALAEVLTFNYLHPFLQQEGGYEVFKEHVPQLEEAWANQYEQVNGVRPSEEAIKNFGTSLKNKAEDFNTMYKEIESTHLPERFVTSSNREEYQEWKGKLFSDKVNVALQYRGVERTKKEIRELSGTISAELLNEQMEFEERKEKAKGTKEYDDLVYEPDPIKIIKLKFLEENRKRAEKELPKLKEQYLKLFTKDGITTHYLNFKDNKKQFKESAAEALKTEAEQLTNNQQEVVNINNVKTEALQKGYTENDVVLFENEEGKRYSMVTENNEQFIYNEKGEKKKVTSKLLENLKLTIVPKEKVLEEQKLANLNEAREAKIAIINEIVTYREELYSKTVDDIKKTNEELLEVQIQLEKFTKELTSLSKLRNKKTAIKNIKSEISKVEKLEKELTERLKHLQDLKFRYEILLDEYKLYESYLQQADISFNELKNIVEKNLLDSIKNDSQTISNDIVETQKAIDRINNLIDEVQKKLNTALEIKNKLTEYLNSGVAFNSTFLILLTKEKELLNMLNDIFDFTLDSKFIDNINELLKTSKISDLINDPNFKSRFLGRASEVARKISSYNANKYFGKPTITKNDVLSLLSSKFAEISEDVERLGLEAKERNDIKNQVAHTSSEVDSLQKQLNELLEQLNLQNLNKQYLVLEEINKEKVEKRFSDIITEGSAKEQIHTQKEITNEPTEKPENISEVFAERQLGINRYVVGGLNILYETEGKNKGFDVLNEEGLPVQNTSVYQQAWYKIMDKIASDPKDKISNYNLVIYKAKYDDSNELEKAIAENNPNPSNRTDSDLFAILLDENNKPVMSDTNAFVFTSIWKPEVLYGEKPRIAPDAILQPYLSNLGIAFTPYKTFSPSKLKKADLAKINKHLQVKEGNFTLEQLYNTALKEAREEYTNWFNSIVDYNNEGAKVYVKPEGITGGKPLQKRDKDRKIIWGNVLTNVPKIKLTKGTGKDKLTGAKLMIVPRSGQLVLSKNVIIPGHPGDVVMVLNNETNIVPVKSRNVTDEEAKLVLYLLSEGDKGSNAVVPLPKGVTYKVGNTEIKDNVAIFFYQTQDKSLNAQLKNFGLLHSIINYGQKTKQENESEEDYRKRNKGTIYAATKTKRVIYTDFQGNSHVVPISDIKTAFATNNFSNPKVAALFEFLKQKRFNISQNLIEQNNKFPYPKLVTKRDNKGNLTYEVSFDNTKSYYEVLLNGDNPVLSTNLVSDPNYPQFVQRNLFFNPMITTTEKKTTKKETSKEKVIKKEEIVETSQKTVEESDNMLPDLTAFNSLTDISEPLSGTDEEILAQVMAAERAALMNSVSMPITSDVLKIDNTEVAEELNENVEEQETSGSLTSLSDIPDLETGLEYMDKVYSPSELLTYKLKSGEITQDCK